MFKYYISFTIIMLLQGCYSSSSEEGDGGEPDSGLDDSGDAVNGEGNGGDTDVDSDSDGDSDLDSDTDSDSDSDSDADNDTDTDTDTDSDSDSDTDTDGGGDDPPECVRYVDINASEGGDGVSWDTAFRVVQEGIDSAFDKNKMQGGPKRCEVWVAKGTYMIYVDSPDDTVQLRPGVNVYGGFKGGELLRSKRDWDTNETLLAGCEKIRGDRPITLYCEFGYGQVYHVVTGNNDTVFDGFVVRGGFPRDDTIHPRGGGMVNSFVSPTVSNVVFSDNRGYAMANYNSSPNVMSCRFDSNSGGIYNNSSNTLIKNCIFDINIGGNGGAIQSTLGSTRIINCVFTDNTGLNGGAIYDYNAQIINSTFLFNEVVNDDWEGPLGEGRDFYGCAKIYNTIISDIINDCGNNFLLKNSNYRGSNYLPGTGNQNSNPHFVDSDWNDFSLKHESPCIDAADDSMAPETDILGNKRYDVRNRGPSLADIGAYEYRP